MDPGHEGSASRQAGKFLLVGGVATLVQYALLVIFVELFSLPAVPASVIAYTLSALLNYLLNYYFTFSSNARHLSALGKFALVAGVGLLANAAVMYLGVEKLHLHYLGAQVMATMTVLIWNFFAHKFWTYRHQ